MMTNLSCCCRQAMDLSPPSTSTATSTSTTPSVSQGQPSKKGKKRKSPSQVSLLRKHIRRYLITCPVALSILRDLGLRSRSTLNSGNFLAWAVEPTDPIFQTIHLYVSKGIPGRIRASWQPKFGTKILSILRISPGGIPPQFDDIPENRGQLKMMLWKGCRPIDARNALKNGLKLEKKSPGKNWGNGYYFSDRIDDALDWSWDMRYAREGGKDEDVFRVGHVAYLFLCEVLLGNEMYYTHTAEPEAPVVTPKQSWWARMNNQGPPVPVTVKSIKVTGLWNPDPQGNREIDGCVWPSGESKLNWKVVLDAFWANSYVVFDEKRVIPRYLVKLEITDGVMKEKIC